MVLTGQQSSKVSAQALAKVHVLVTEEFSDDQQHEVWRAVVLQMPHLVAEGESREQALAVIKKMLTQSVRRAEVVTFSLLDQEEAEDPLAANGYRHYGIFADDPEALKLFDEIEEERNKHIVEPVQS
ncbi:MAG: hypothetical protein ACREEM_54510 [Blastocatellia bacterium]